MFSDAVVLVGQTFDTNENGVQYLVTETVTTVYGHVLSATRQEFAVAGQRGLKALYRVDIWAEEYSGQELAIVNGQRLPVYRTFRKGERLELYLGEKVGVNE